MAGIPITQEPIYIKFIVGMFEKGYCITYSGLQEDEGRLVEFSGGAFVKNKIELLRFADNFSKKYPNYFLRLKRDRENLVEDKIVDIIASQFRYHNMGVRERTSLKCLEYSLSNGIYCSGS